MSIIKHTFPNNLTLLVQESPAHELVSINFWVRAGSQYEGAFEGSGISHLLEHLVFKGTRSFSAKELAERVQELGGQWNAYTSTNCTVYHIDGPSTAATAFLTILHELVFHPTLPMEEWEKERDVIRREMAMYADDPESVAEEFHLMSLFSTHPRRWPVLGIHQCFDSLRHDDLLAYHSSLYTPSNTIVSIAGAVNPQEIIKKLESLSSETIDRYTVLPTLAMEPHQWGKRVRRKPFATPVSRLSITWKLLPPTYSEAPALVALAQILSKGDSAMLYHKYFDQLGLVHDIDARYAHTQGEIGTFTISASVDVDKRDQVRDLLVQEIASLAQHDFSKQLPKVVKQVMVSKLKSLASVSGMAAAQAADFFATANEHATLEWFDGLKHITPQQLQHACATYFPPHLYTETSLDPIASAHSGETTTGAMEVSKPTLHTLPNGLRVCLQRDTRIPLVYLCFAANAGSRAETIEQAGITEMMAGMLTKGTASRDSMQIAEALEKEGGSLDITSGNNSLLLEANVLVGHVSTMIELVADVLLRPVFPAGDLENNRALALSDLSEEKENPIARALMELGSACYDTTSYGIPLSGTEASLQAITREDLQLFHGRVVNTANAVLSLVGDFDESNILEQIETHFYSMPKGKPIALAPTIHPTADSNTIVELEKEQAAIVVHLPAPHITSAAAVHARLLNAWCSDMAGPVFTTIREQAALAYFASSHYFQGTDAGGLIFFLGAAPEQATQAKEKLASLLNQLSMEGIDADSFRRIKTSLASQLALGRQSMGNMSASFALDVLYGLPVDNHYLQDSLLQELGLDSFNSFIYDTLNRDTPHTWVCVTPKS